MQQTTPTRSRICALFLTLALLLSFAGCVPSTVNPPATTAGTTASSAFTLEIINGDAIELTVGAVFSLSTNTPTDEVDRLQWFSSMPYATVDELGRVTAVAEGETIITVYLGQLSDSIRVRIYESGGMPDVTHPVTDPEDPNTDPPKTESPAISPERDKFYGSADPADSHGEALERSARGELSGATTVPDQAPIRLSYQPKQGSLLIRNSKPYYADTNTFVVVDAYGAEVFRVYRGGGYITLEEVAAYVYAFGDVPANYVSNKNTDPQDSIWGEYLRLNHSAFSGNTSKYPYEPVLPRISGCGGDLYYYEIDIGTTGTDCDPGYYAGIYNNGYSITRGAARIVYTRYDANRNNIIDPNEKYVFYTYNHYNDFQEYLNYYGGWGAMFGNITGGGTLSSKYDYNPTPYVQSVLAPLPQQARSVAVLIRLPAIDDLYGKRRVA